jgi:hypothetical protein
MTIHESAIERRIARMQKEGMVSLAAETIRRAIADAEDELAQSRKDIDEQLARIDDDERYVAELEQRVAALRARLRQIEAVPS